MEPLSTSTSSCPVEVVNPERPIAVLEGEDSLKVEILQQWEMYRKMQLNLQHTHRGMHGVGAHLGELFFHLKRTLARPGRNGQWCRWLRDHYINRATADRLAQRYAARLPKAELPPESVSDPTEADITKLFSFVWPRIEVVLTTKDSLLRFLACIANRGGLAQDWREDRLIIYHPSLTGNQADTRTTVVVKAANADVEGVL